MNININKWIIGLMIGISIVISGCAPKPIKIGLSAEITGTRGELGVMVRNGAQLAVDEINAADGINGRPLELLIRDDQGDPDLAKEVDQDLIDAGVVAIIGHITSGQTAAVIDLANSAEMVLISGSASGSQFNQKDDYFLRTVSSADRTGAVFADYISNTKDIQNISYIFDDQNSVFAVPFLDAMSDRFTDIGVTVVDTISFTSGEIDLEDLVNELDTQGNYVVIASAVDTALIMQYVSLGDFQGEFTTSSWAGTSKLIEAGGQAVEGLELISAFDPQNNSPIYQSFTERYQIRYGEQPGPLAPKAYDIVYILASALDQTGGSVQGLREELLTVKDFEGVEGLITFDQYGDALVPLYIMKVNQGQFETIETLNMPGQ